MTKSELSAKLNALVVRLGPGDIVSLADWELLHDLASSLLLPPRDGEGMMEELVAQALALNAKVTSLALRSRPHHGVLVTVGTERFWLHAERVK